MQATDFGKGDDRAEGRRLDRPPVGCILVEREVSAGPVIVREVGGEYAAQVPLAENDDMVQTLAPDRTDESLREGVLPRAARGDENFTDSHPLHSFPEGVTVDRIAVAEEVDRSGLVWEGVHDLLGGPVAGGMLRDVEVDDAPAMVSEHDENEEDTKASGRHGEEVDRDQVAEVVSEKRPPGLRGSGAWLGHEPGNGALGDVDPELEELSVDAGRTPQRIGCGHFPDECGDLGVDGRASASGPAREPGPILAEAAALPAQDGIRRDDDQRPPPASPDSGQADPEQTVGRAELRAGRESLVDSELLAEGQVLEGELAVAAYEEGEEPEEVE